MTHYVALTRLIKKTVGTDKPVTWAALEASGVVPAKHSRCEQAEFFRHVQAQLDVFEESSQPDNEGETP